MSKTFFFFFAELLGNKLDASCCFTQKFFTTHRLRIRIEQHDTTVTPKKINISSVVSNIWFLLKFLWLSQCPLWPALPPIQDPVPIQTLSILSVSYSRTVVSSYVGFHGIDLFEETRPIVSIFWICLIVISLIMFTLNVFGKITT